MRLRPAVVLSSLIFASAVAAAAPPAPPERLGADAVPRRYAAKLAIDPAAPTFAGSIDIELTVRRPTPLLWLNGTELTVDKAWLEVGGRRRPARVVAGGVHHLGFATAAPLPVGDAKLHVEYRGKLSNNESRGLFHEQEAGAWYAGTQLEAIYARRVFPCFDEPGFKVPWQLTLEVDKDLVALSNTQATSVEVTGKKKTVRFAATPPLPSYLLAIAVGPFDLVDAGRAGARHVPVRLAVPRGRAADAAYAASLTPQIIERLEGYFGIPYPYEKLEIFTMPLSDVAMENAGLIMTTVPSMVAKPADRSLDFEREFVYLMLHEIGHQWFGDLVTCAWWDDIWLNEAFATWITTKLADEWHPEWSHHTRAVSERDRAMDSDSLASARQIRQPIRTTDDILNTIDDITYQKGASVLGMFEAWVGPDKWRAGIHDYLQAHAHGTATLRDFVSAVSAAAGRDLMPPLESLVDQTGVPLVSMQLACGAGKPSLTLTQERYVPLGSPGAAAQQTWQLPVCLEWSAGGTVGHSCTLIHERQTTVALDAARCPDWILGNQGERGYYRTAYQGDLLGKLMKDAARHLSLPELVGVLDDMGALTFNGRLPIADALATLPPLAADPRREVVSRTAAAMTRLRPHLIPPAQKANYVRLVQKLYGARARSLGWATRPGDDEDKRLLRAALVPLVADHGEDAALADEATRLAKAWLRDRKAVSVDLSDAVLDSAAHAGDAALFDAYLAEAPKADRADRDRLLRALAHFRHPPLTARLLGLVLDDRFDAREMSFLPLVAGEWPETRELTWSFMQSHFDALVKRLGGESVAFFPWITPGFCDEPHRAEAEAFFGPRITSLPGGPRVLAQALEATTVCDRYVRAQAASAASFLRRY
jgi:alanyl aminopeptidase